MLNVKKLLGMILNAIKTDYVIDEGTSGSWEYRKWNSGRYECWKRAVGQADATYTAWGSLFYKDVAAGSFPITFASQPTVLITPYGSQAYVLGCYGISTSSLGTIRFGHNGTSKADAYANVYAFGYWK